MTREPTFQEFWDRYGKKRERQDAERAWQGLTPGERRSALEGIDRYRRECSSSGRQMLYAQGYLNQRRWRGVPGRKGTPPSPALPPADPLEEMETW